MRCTLLPIVNVSIGDDENAAEVKSEQAVAFHVTDFKWLQLEKALLLIDVADVPILNDVNMQLLKALFSIEVTELGMLTDVRPLQL